VGLADAFHAVSPVRLTRFLLHAPDGTAAGSPLPELMWGLSRERFDAMLLDEATRAGAALRQPARAESVRGGRPPTVRVRDLATNEVRELRPGVVVVADGKGIVADLPAPDPSGDFGIKAHFTGVDGPADAIELFSTSGRYGGLAAIEGGRWNAAFSVSGEQLKCFGGNVDALFGSLVEGNVTLARRLRRAARVGDWLASPLPRFGVRTGWPAGVIPVGNAAAAIEPIGGEGMGLAMRSAELAAEAILNRTGAKQLLADYQRLWRVRRPACRAAAVALSSSRTSGEVLSLLKDFAGLLSAGMRLVGK
jgi:2-polyprenyl-6-methoxyphenol hydroxylase-like FAD-dependent oxidoreductase